jgi:RimJ/RimL family protein N-acetyltransferase
MNADPRVTEFLPTPLTREMSDAMVARVEAHFEKQGFGLWAVEIPGGWKSWG